MSNRKLQRIKIKIDYDSDVPRCNTCKNYKKAKTVLVNSLPRFQFQRCSLHNFKPDEFGLCKDWVDKKTKQVLE
jgi:hypothetical protein